MLNPTNPNKDFLSPTYGDEKVSKELETVGSIAGTSADSFTQAVQNGGRG